MVQAVVSPTGGAGGSVDRDDRPGGPLTALDAAQMLDALRACSTVLDHHADALDLLAREPEWPSGTEVMTAPGASEIDNARTGPGVDLAATLAAACQEAAGATDYSALCRGLAAGSSSAARTRAGRRFAAFLGGMADAMRNADRIDGNRLSLSLESGAERVTESDDGTHPGCLISVMAATADGALGASDDGADLAEVLVSAAEAGLVELEAGPTTDARLAERGTVDPAAAGFLLVLDSLAAWVAGDPLPEPPRPGGPGAGGNHARVAPGTVYVVRCHVTPEVPDIEVAADVEALVHEMSDRVRFDGSGTACWSVEVVTTLPGAVVEALSGAGTLGELHIGIVDPA